MPKQPDLLTERIAELRGRATAVSWQIQRDAELLLDVHRELSDALTGLGQLRDQPPPPLNQAAERRILRNAEVSKVVGLARSSIWKLTKEGSFPAPRRISTKAVGWKSVDIDDWLGTRQTTIAPTQTKSRRLRS